MGYKNKEEAIKYRKIQRERLDEMQEFWENVEVPKGEFNRVYDKYVRKFNLSRY